ncbi:transposase [Conexibacter sp. W3-3-2]|uniref:transposase n=1 Tax=Conexibacter sp. W3-3-2 TaxID=2675227 RepID=UPI0035C8A43A
MGALRVHHQPHRRPRARRGRAPPARTDRAGHPRPKTRPSRTSSGRFCANSAWTVLAAIAHNLLRWTQLLGAPNQTIRTARTLRRRWLTLPGRLTRTARRWTLHLPARWPWRNAFTQALERIRALQPA